MMFESYVPVPGRIPTKGSGEMLGMAFFTFYNGLGI